MLRILAEKSYAVRFPHSAMIIAMRQQSSTPSQSSSSSVVSVITGFGPLSSAPFTSATTAAKSIPQTDLDAALAKIFGGAPSSSSTTSTPTTAASSTTTTHTVSTSTTTTADSTTSSTVTATVTAQVQPPLQQQQQQHQWGWIAQRAAQWRREREAVRAALLPLRARRDALSSAAEAYPHRVLWSIFAFLCLQNAVFFNWVFVLFDWNLVEPVTYFVGYSSATWMALMFYGSTGREFSYDATIAELKARRLARLLQHEDASAAAAASASASEQNMRKSNSGPLLACIEHLEHEEQRLTTLLVQLVGADEEQAAADRP